jgi:hypothetical protein
MGRKDSGMAVFSPRDHRGSILEPGTNEPAGLTKGRQFTLGQVMTAIIVAAVIIAGARQRPAWPILPDVGVLILILAACLYGISGLPFRVRLTIELATAGFLLILAAWIWRPPFYVYQAERTEQLARLCWKLADKADDEHARGLFRREAAEYGRRARVLRLRGMWYGLLRSATKEDPVFLTERELILELGLLEALDQHELIGEQTGIPKQPRRP